MRVLRYILRFLGISAIILYLLASLARADDVTVNFPSTMTVNGEVQVQGLGMEGNPTYDSTITDSPGDTGLIASTSEVLTGTNGAPETFATTYISGYKKIKVWGGSTTPSGTAGTSNTTAQGFDIVIAIPNFDWQKLRSDLKLAIFGQQYVGANPTVLVLENQFFPGIRQGTVSLNNATQTYLTSTVTDFTGTNNWQIQMDWKDLAGISANANYSIYGGSFHFKQIFTILIQVFSWYECFYLMIAKVSNG